MALNQQLVEALNDQINAELYSAYLYLAMGAYCESENMAGAAHWMEMQAQEETMHAMKMYRFISDRGGRVELDAIAKPPVEFDSIQDLFERTLEHEQDVTARINKLYKAMKDEDDFAGQIFMEWFVTEQIEEEKNVSDILDLLKMVGSQGQGLFMVNKELGARPAPTPLAAEE
jgi:ferritin